MEQEGQRGHCLVVAVVRDGESQLRGALSTIVSARAFTPVFMLRHVWRDKSYPILETQGGKCCLVEVHACVRAFVCVCVCARVSV